MFSYFFKELKNNSSTTWRLLIMLNIAQIFWALLSIFDRSKYIEYVWKIKWFVVHFKLMQWINWGLYYTIDAIVKDINAIMVIERYIAVKMPFKYKVICTKKRIYTAVILCVLIAIMINTVPVFTFGYIGKVPCIKRLSYRHNSFSDEFKYFTLCYAKHTKRPFAKNYKKLLYNLFDLFGAFASLGIPQLIITVFGFLTLRVFRRTTKPTNSNTGSGLNISESIILRRSIQERQLTKLVLGLVFINLSLAVFQLLEWLYISGMGRLHKRIDQLFGDRVYHCVYNAIHLGLSIVFSLNPIFYILYNSTIRNNIKTCCPSPKCIK